MPDETKNVTEPVATAQTAGSDNGSAAATATQTATTTPTPSYKPEEVERWKTAAGDYDYLKGWLDTNPDLRDAILARHEGRTKPPQPLSEAQKPDVKLEPIMAEVQQLRSLVDKVVSEKTREEAEKEVQATLQKYPFIGGRDKLDEAYKAVAKEMFNNKVFSGLDAVTAKREVEAELNALPLEYFVYEKFQPQLQEHLVKSRTQGALPPSIGSRGDTVNNGQAGFTQGFFDGKAKAFKETSGNVDRQYEVVVQTAREMGLELEGDEGIDNLRRVEVALRSNNPKALGG